MTDPSGASPDDETDQLHYRLAEELERLRAVGGRPDPAELATRFGLPRAQVEFHIAAHAALAATPADEGTAKQDAQHPPKLPDDYEILRPLGRGAMGVVWCARQKSLDRVVAVKVLRPGELLFAEVLQRFRKESLLLARLRHPHIVSVHEVGEADGSLFFTMDYVAGSTLGDLIRRGEMTPSRAVHLLRQVTSGVAHAHAQGLVHRDLKPANILVDPQGEAFLVDFGLAREVQVPRDLTLTGQVLGTPAYMSPEQARGDSAHVGEASDIYALGATLYDCLTGRPPFGGAALADQVHAVLHADPVPPRRLNPKVPRDLEIICLKALAKRPEHRYATARALLEDLERFEEGRLIRAVRPGFGERVLRFVRRRWLPLTASATAAGLVGVIGWVWGEILPLIGATPETLMTVAEDRCAKGQHAAAIGLYERVIEDTGWTRADVARALDFFPIPRSSPSARLHEDLVRCRLHLAAGMADAGLHAEATALLGTARRDATLAFGERDWEAQCELLDHLAYSQAWGGDVQAAVASLTERQQLIDAGLFTDKSYWYGSREKTLTWLAPHLESTEPAELQAAAFVTAALLLNGSGSWMMDWFEQSGRHPPLDDLLHVLHLFPEDLRLSLQEVLETGADRLWSRDLGSALAAAVGDATLDEPTRSLAVDLLCAVADLPWRRPAGTELRVPHPERERAVSLWRETQALTRGESFHRRVAAAIAFLEEAGAHGSRDVEDWLVTHTGYVSGTVGGSRWSDWWETHRFNDPRDWLAEALRLAETPPTDDVPGLVERFLRAEGLERASWHQLMLLTVPDDAQAPRWPTARPEPDGLASSWRGFLRPATDAAHVFRTALFVLLDGEPEPIKLREEIRALRIGESVQVEEPVALGDPWYRCVVGIRLPVWGEFGATEWSEFVRALDLPCNWRVHGRLDWGPHGLTLRALGIVPWLSRGITRYSWLHMESSARLGEAAALGLIVETGLRPDARPHHTLALALVDPPGGDEAPWTVEQWSARLAETLEACAERGARAVADGRPPFESIEEVGLAPYVAVWLPVPAANGALARLDALASGRVAAAHGAILPARLLAGDASALDEPDFARRLDESVATLQLDGPYWARVLLAVSEPRIQELALSRLRAGVDRVTRGVDTASAHPAAASLPLGSAAAIDRAAREGRLALPEWLAEQVRGADRRVRWESARYALGPLAAALGLLLATIVLSALALWPRRRPERRLLPAALLLACGLTGASVVLSVDGFDLTPDWLGLGAATVASTVLARSVRGGFAACWTATFLGTAFLAEVLGQIEAAPAWARSLASASTAAGILALPLLVRVLDPVGPDGRRPARVGLWALAIAFGLASVEFSLATNVPALASSAWGHELTAGRPAPSFVDAARFVNDVPTRGAFYWWGRPLMAHATLFVVIPLAMLVVLVAVARRRARMGLDARRTPS